MTDTLRLDDHRPAPTAGNDSGDGSVALPAPSAAPESCFFDIDMEFSFMSFSRQPVQENPGPAQSLHNQSLMQRSPGASRQH
jgi:hypothetical protein